ncbi:hypothetical protein TNCV_3180011 [Trichonephila clavipes]|nr:hypothetical protein TNCV_3180011 [Trichonephila clavipes]
MVEALNLPNQAPRVSGESLQTCGAWLMEHNTPLLLANSGRFWSIASFKRSVGDKNDLNLVFGHTKVTHNKLFLSSSSKYTVEPSGR